MKETNKDDNKNGCFGCLGCLGLLLIIALLFGACGAIFGDDEEPKVEEESVEEESVIKAEKERVAAEEKAEKESEAKKKVAAEEKTKENEAKKEAETQNFTDSDKDCSDFANSHELMAFFHENGYNAANDPHELDRDSDGLPCEITQSEYDSFVSNQGNQEVPVQEEDATSETEVESAPETVPSNNISYDNCAAVRAAGAAPIRTGDPGYGSHLDRDGDGVACET